MVVNPNDPLISLLSGFDILKLNSTWLKGHQTGNLRTNTSVVQIVTIRNSDAHETTDVM